MKRSIILLMLAAVPLFADVELQNSINDVYYRGSHELVGSITMTPSDNDFAGASPEQPIYIRCSLDDGAVLANTLVDLNAEDQTTRLPVYLALEVFGRDANVRNNAPARSVSIVRWLEGERDIWIRVESDSSTWIIDGQGNVRAPDDDHKLSFTLGISARSSYFDNQEPERSNLPFNTRDPETAADASAAVSTLMCVDLRQSTLTSMGNDSLLGYSLIAYQADAETSPGVFEPQNPAGVNFVGGFRIARGKDRAPVVISSRMSDQLSCSREDDLLALETRLILTMSSDSDVSLLDTYLTDGSQLVLLANGDFGFDADFFVDVEGGWTGAGSVLVDEGAAFEIGERTYYKRLILTWNGGHTSTRGAVLDLESRLVFPNGLIDAEQQVAWEMALFNHGGAEDEAPFDGPDQIRRCQPTIAFEDNGSVEVIWVAAPDRDRDRLLPHITLDGTSFTTDIVMSNPSAESAGYILNGFDVTGRSLGYLIGALAPRSREVWPAVALFENPDLAHLRVQFHSSVLLSAAYRATGEAKAPATVSERETRSHRWRVELGRPELTFDGVAIVNPNEEEVTLNVFEIGHDGTLLNTIDNLPTLSSGQKLTLVLEASEAESHYIFEASHRITVLALRGSHDGSFLWENPALPFDTF